EEEFENALHLVQYIMNTLGLTEYGYRFSKWNPEDKGKYIDNPKAWEESQASLKKILDKQGLKYEEAAGEAAFYGPKLDIQMKNVWGKEDTIFTLQIDFALPERFDMEYIDRNNSRIRPIVIHRSSIGCYERTIALLIEKYAGAFPLWLAPVQVMLINITDEQINYLKNIEKILKENNIRVETDLRNEKMPNKVKDAIVRKIPYMFIIGKNEEKDGSVSVRTYKEGNLGSYNFMEYVNKLKKEIEEKVIR
ncbi:MAG: His/Gly/Thr/Pro-type tRNA ligase C-terminal domain-containing protein, partial [bacterium]|nr:His/Gly/Thr/Pro-type tRNA ligase C-terminal domain-containing protein [bacterium]